MKRSLAAQELSFTLTLTTGDLMRRVQTGEVDPHTVVEALRMLEQGFAARSSVDTRLQVVRDFLDIVLPAWVEGEVH